jgi:outer membrane lipoprotein-sorting protein
MNTKRLTRHTLPTDAQPQTTGWRSTRRRVLSCALAFGLAAWAGCCASAAEAEFSADLTILSSTGMSMSGKVFVKGPKKRNEVMIRGYPATTILRQDRKVTWTLFAATKEYRETPLKFDPLNPASDSPYEIKEMGQGKANGYDCKLILWTFKNPEQGSVLQWFTPELDMAVRYQVKNKGGTMVTTTDYRNVKAGPQADSLFEIPPGYRWQASAPKPAEAAPTK